MKEITRYNCFETNSSMTHSCVIMPKKVYEEWESSEKYIFLDDSMCYFLDYFKMIPESKRPQKGHLYTKEEALKFMNINNFLDLKDVGFCKWDDWYDTDLYIDTNYYTSESGDEFVMCCKYGHD